MAFLTGTLAPISNAATWADSIEFRDSETDDLINITSDVSTITVKLRHPQADSTVLEGSMAGGEVTILSTGTVDFSFTAAQMANILPGTYEFGTLLTFKQTAGGNTVQVILANVPVVKGL